MLIKALRLKGFKSFADETYLTFSKGINCIVGPNGCGKSNIVDALKWAIGDTSAKGMRTDSLRDVVFKGSEGRRSARTAEVCLLLAREDLFSLPEPEVEIKRRIKINGEGEFFINRRKVRLKDIQEFFASIGIGNRDYAFIEQGQVDRVLRMKPYERKLLIEEAAQITPFKEKRAQTLKQLESAEQNLKNLKGVVDEVEKNLAGAKNTRFFTQLGGGKGERGRKCSICGERNVVVAGKKLSKNLNVESD